MTEPDLNAVTVQGNEASIHGQKVEDNHDVDTVQGKTRERSTEDENLECDKAEDQESTSQSQLLVEAARAALVAAASLRDERLSVDAPRKEPFEVSGIDALGDTGLPHFACNSEERDYEGNEQQVTIPRLQQNVFNERESLELQGSECGNSQESRVIEATSRGSEVGEQSDTKEALLCSDKTDLQNQCSITAICSENTGTSNTLVPSSPKITESYSEQSKKLDDSNSSSAKESSSFVAASKQSSFSRPADSRVFIGNLASERTTVAELVSIFSRYGNLIEEPVIRRSFGFVQYDNADSAYRAIEAEQGRVIGGMPIDLSLADNRDSRRNSRTHSGVGPDKSKRNFSADRFNPYDRTVRSNTVTRSARNSKGNFRRPRRYDSRNGVAVRVLVMGQHARGYAHSCEATIRAFLGLQTDVVYIEANKLGDSLELAKEQLVPYVIVVNSKDERDGSCSLRILDSEGYQKLKGGSLPFREVLNIIVEEEDLEQQVIMNMNALAPLGLPSGIDTTLPPSGPSRSSGRSGNARAARDSHRNLTQSSTSLNYPTYSNSSSNTQSWPIYGAVSSSPGSSISSVGIPGQPSSLMQNQSLPLNPQQQPMTQNLGYVQNQVQTNVGISNANPYASLLNSLSMLQQSQNSSQPGIASSGHYSMPNALSSGQQTVDLAKVANTLSSLSQFQQQPPPMTRSSNYSQTAVSSGYNIANMLQSLQNNTLPNVSSGIPSISSQLPGSSSASVPTNLLQLLQQAQAHVAMAQQQQQQQSHPSQTRR
ncbi:hypothetical protein GpartN1_g3627.t1 [Galdieria partita]|uniref:RRM domain-containing protein n=1 Tax=Galdieria partita TaxID=83374 RepID=A0A9C7PXT8_9RHOD|nr:hypothetical protein GpartN1_g3627.t1 [Galdieria partita]